jgi:protein SCO1
VTRFARLAVLLACLAGAADGRPALAPKLGAQIDTDALFADAEGRRAPLAAILDGRPALLLLGYHTCPNLCGVIQNQVADALTRTGLDPARYRVLFVSIAAGETPADALAARQALARAVPQAEIGAWRFLTGPGADLAAQVGLEFERRARVEQYAHPAAILALTPDGRLARALPALTFEARDLRLALVEAAGGTIGTLADRITLLCAAYDETQGQYTPVVMSVVRAGGVLMLVLGVAGVCLLARRRT